ncbi:hypothetical protein LY76DRAFT_597860 [Colletotrichum caudatum]|nr:hypothetical protein LY76DRAFT_597860 [Colletotrichum caudatum]
MTWLACLTLQARRSGTPCSTGRVTNGSFLLCLPHPGMNTASGSGCTFVAALVLDYAHNTRHTP